jgi:hypothetical protein
MEFSMSSDRDNSAFLSDQLDRNLTIITAAPAHDRDGHRLPGRFDAVTDGKVLVAATRQPFLDGARALLAEGANPQATIILKHPGSETVCLRARLGAAAKLTVEESNRGKPTFRRWKPRPLSPEGEPQSDQTETEAGS